MNEQEIKDKMKLAEKLVGDLSSDLKVTAFKSILDFLLKFELEESYSNRSKTRETSSVSSLISLPEIITNKNPKSYTDKAIVISYFMFKHEGVENFNANQIGENFSKARVPKPSNMTDTLNRLIGRGLLREGELVDGNKGFVITKKGIEYVETFKSK